jgi:hypothetical protein
LGLDVKPAGMQPEMAAATRAARATCSTRRVMLVHTPPKDRRFPRQAVEL